MILIWDIWIRLFHLSLAIAVMFLLLSGETSIGFFDWHRTVGELVLALIVFRLVWSVIGSSNASLLRLMKPPGQVFRHLRNLIKDRGTQQRGHNAAGGWAVLIILASILFQAISGMFIADELELVEGAFYGTVHSTISAQLFKLHMLNARLIEMIFAIHILMIFFYAIYAKQNLIVPMITGRMSWIDQNEPPKVILRHWAFGLIAAIIIGLIFKYYLF